MLEGDGIYGSLKLGRLCQWATPEPTSLNLSASLLSDVPNPRIITRKTITISRCVNPVGPFFLEKPTTLKTILGLPSQLSAFKYRLKGKATTTEVRWNAKLTLHVVRDTETEGDKCSVSTIKFLCSYGGKIVPRNSDGKLRYVGGFTRILSVDSSISYAELMEKLGEFCGFSVVLRCQLPNCDLETLVTIKSDEELANLVEEYEKASSSSPQKIRAVLPLQGSSKVVSPPTSSASSVDSSGYNSPVHVTGDHSCFRSRLPSPRVGELRCYPCDDVPRVGRRCFWR